MRVKSMIAAVALAWFAISASAMNPSYWKSTEWPDTDFELTNITDWSEILSGGPPKDGIPALDGTNFLPVADESRIGDREPVITVEIDGAEPRAYPIRYLTWHEIVNDEINGVPIAVTFCPLCNSAITFDRRAGDRVLSFGVSGLLRNSDMVMYDRETQSWWQQAIGVGIVGEMTDVELVQLPTWMESWSEFKERNPDGLVMDQPAGFRRPYGDNPYANYDSSRTPFLYNGEMPPHDIPALMRVVRVGDAAWTFERLRKEEEITENGVTLTWTKGQASALDSRSIEDGKEVGTVRVRNAKGEDVPHDVLFAFAFHAFFPDGDWKLGN